MGYVVLSDGYCLKGYPLFPGGIAPYARSFNLFSCQYKINHSGGLCWENFSMRVAIIVMTLAIVGLYLTTAVRDDAIVMHSSIKTRSTGDAFPETGGLALVADDEVPPLPEERSERTSSKTTKVVIIGEQMDPDDPSLWPQTKNIQASSIGEPMDPDGPWVWPPANSSGSINIGEFMDPDDPLIGPRTKSTEFINIGESMDPDDPLIWPYTKSIEIINLGEPMDPDDPFILPR